MKNTIYSSIAILIFMLFSCKEKEKKEQIKLVDKSSEKVVENSIKDIPKQDIYQQEVQRVLDEKYVTAKKGLLCRDKPNGKVIGKFDYIDKVDVVERTGIKFEVYDNEREQEIKGEWVGVNFKHNTTKKGYVFSGYLDYYHGIDIRDRIKIEPIKFEKRKVNGVVFSGTYKLYNEKLQEIGSFKADTIKSVNILRISEKKRPKFKNQEYCQWSNYVELICEGKKMIIFGSKVASISYNKDFRLKNSKTINLILAENFTMEAADEDGLTGCDDFSYMLIKENNNYSYFFSFSHDEGGTENFSSLIAKENTLVGEVAQSFQEGTGSYTLKIFNKGGWKYEVSNRKRFTEDGRLIE